jgi:hypothetical protein
LWNLKAEGLTSLGDAHTQKFQVFTILPSRVKIIKMRLCEK